MHILTKQPTVKGPAPESGAESDWAAHVSDEEYRCPVAPHARMHFVDADDSLKAMSTPAFIDAVAPRSTRWTRRGISSDRRAR